MKRFPRTKLTVKLRAWRRQNSDSFVFPDSGTEVLNFYYLTSWIRQVLDLQVFNGRSLKVCAPFHGAITPMHARIQILIHGYPYPPTHTHTQTGQTLTCICSQCLLIIDLSRKVSLFRVFAFVCPIRPEAVPTNHLLTTACVHLEFGLLGGTAAV